MNASLSLGIAICPAEEIVLDDLGSNEAEGDAIPTITQRERIVRREAVGDRPKRITRSEIHAVCFSLPVEAGSFLPAFLVLNKDTKHQPEPSRPRCEKAENGQTGITKYLKTSLDLHQE